MQQSRDNRNNQSLRSLLEIQNEVGVLWQQHNTRSKGATARRGYTLALRACGEALGPRAARSELAGQASRFALGEAYLTLTPARPSSFL
jgi:hypothetical protein